MGDFKSEYRRAVDNIEPDGRLTEYLKADMKAAIEAPSGSFHVPPRPNFFIRYGWAFGSAAACLVAALAVGVFLSLGRPAMESSGAADADHNAGNNALDIDMGIAENSPEYAEPGADDADGFNGDGSQSAVTTTSMVSAMPGEAESGPVLTDMTGDADERSDIFSSIIETDQRGIAELKAVSYEELKALVAVQQESGLTLGDIDFYAYDTITEFGYDYSYGTNEVYLVMRYDYGGSACPLIAVFSGSSPSDSLKSLRLYFGYDTPYRFVDLSLMTAEAFENYIMSDEKRPFGNSDMPFDDSELKGFETISPTRLREWAALAAEGELTYGELERCGHVTKLYKGLYTMGCLYSDEKTGKSYALISCYFVQSAEAAPAYVILREMDSGDTLDLLHEYDMLDRFLAE